LIYLDLLLNLSFLVAFTVVSGFLEGRWPRHTRRGQLAQGALFGVAAVLGMLRPLVLGPGVIFDGRSVMVSLCTLFFGPWAGGVAVALTAGGRLVLGGAGTLTGVLVILTSAGIGRVAYARWATRERPPSVGALYGFGLTVHLAMLALMFTLPEGAGLGVVRRLGLPILAFYPLATILVGKILADQVAAQRTLAALEASRESLETSEAVFRALFEDHAAAKLLIDPASGAIVDANRAAAAFYGWSRDELRGLRIQDINTLPAAAVEAEMARAEQRIYFEFRHRRADGSVRDVAVFSSRIAVRGRNLFHSIIHDISAMKSAQAALLESEMRFRLLVEHAPDAIFVQTGGCFRFLNHTALDLFGAAVAQDLLGAPVVDRFREDFRDGVRERICALNEAGRPVSVLREAALRLDGSPVWVEVSAVPMHYEGEDGALVFARDVSAKVEAEETHQNLEEQLRQAQKLESVGRLAGGVAHDFNNMLGVILGHAELALGKLPPDADLREDLEAIHCAAERSAEVTRQLLAFARKQAVEPRVVELNSGVEGFLQMLRRLIGEDVHLVWQPGRQLWPVKIDPSQLDQLLANLCVNARDAIAGVGTLRIATANTTVDAAACAAHPAASAGEFVQLAVSDDGCGMDGRTLELIFEPFFTTKPVGEGTGLGLATVYGIVQQNGGFVQVESEPGRGATFRIHLPRHRGEAAADPAARTAADAPQGRGEVLLVVEDEPAILALTRTLLGDLGYVVLTATTGPEALRLADDHPGPLHLLLSDVVMPGLGGGKLAKRLRERHPELKVLFMSGYTADVIGVNGVLAEGVHFLQKPFSRRDLAQKVRESLDGALPAPAPAAVR